MTAILSCFTLANSNHERKSSPIEKIVFCVRSFLTRCLKGHRSKFTGHAPPIPNSSGRSAGAIGDGCVSCALFVRPAGQHDEAAPVSRRRGSSPASSTSSRPRSSHTSIQIRVSMGRPAAALARPLVRRMLYRQGGLGNRTGTRQRGRTAYRGHGQGRATSAAAAVAADMGNLMLILWMGGRTR